ncbi:hypothetical protein HS088_TW03G01227 [Tripterygium wilfordii]|uniref:SnoaL-like domain-containing protein n=1 Tax=Tripterygium wilfordii TaxID=458696 RepID=A0A7J7DX41_TRIWF|nr:hypothetical protein HS088_TW03G01227 [Tripterygium wilfordii]
MVFSSTKAVAGSVFCSNEDSRAAVLAANARFYNSFREGDLAVIQTISPKGDNCCCVHPGASGVIGYDNVMESWTKGSSGGAQFVTNVFEKINGQLFICVHHASPVDL